MEERNYVIDPLTSFCKVALLYFMPKKTKLAVSHHTLSIQYAGYYQWFERMVNGNSRMDIAKLNDSFIYGIKWYVLNTKERVEMTEETLQSILTIVRFTIKGFIKQQKEDNYQHDTAIQIILQYFINMLQSALDGSWDENKYVHVQSNGLISQKLKYAFNVTVIQSIAKMLENAEKISGTNSQTDINVLIKCAHKLLNNQKNISINLMKK